MEHQIKFLCPTRLLGRSIPRSAAAVAQALVIPLVIQTIRRVQGDTEPVLQAVEAFLATIQPTAAQADFVAQNR
jgi:uncharacterized protein YbbK (DUF523 family)